MLYKFFLTCLLFLQIYQRHLTLKTIRNEDFAMLGDADSLALEQARDHDEPSAEPATPAKRGRKRKVVEEPVSFDFLSKCIGFKLVTLQNQTPLHVPDESSVHIPSLYHPSPETLPPSTPIPQHQSPLPPPGTPLHPPGTPLHHSGKYSFSCQKHVQTVGTNLRTGTPIHAPGTPMHPSQLGLPPGTPSGSSYGVPPPTPSYVGSGYPETPAAITGQTPLHIPEGEMPHLAADQVQSILQQQDTLGEGFNVQFIYRVLLNCSLNHSIKLLLILG